MVPDNLGAKHQIDTFSMPSRADDGLDIKSIEQLSSLHFHFHR